MFHFLVDLSVDCPPIDHANIYFQKRNLGLIKNASIIRQQTPTLPAGLDTVVGERGVRLSGG